MYQQEDLLGDLGMRQLVPVSKWTRFAHLIIDALIIGVLQQAAGAALKIPIGVFDGNQFAAGIFEGIAIGLAIKVLYYFICESTSSATVGKLITGSRIIKTDGSACTSNDILKRSLCRLIPFNEISFLIQARSGWHDTITDTAVVSKKDWQRILNVQ
jgi:uncharacterized RDD family membrane protein YckC